MNSKAKFLLVLQAKAVPDLTAVKKWAQLQWPTVVLAQDLQKRSDFEDFISCFAKDQLHILSHDVDDSMQFYPWLLEQADRLGLSHIAFVATEQEAVRDALREREKNWESSDKTSVFFTTLPDWQPKNNWLMQRLFDLDEQDYRSLKTETCLLPTSLLKKIQWNTKDGLDSVRILLHILWHRKVYEKVPVLEVAPSLPGRGWKTHLYDFYLLALSSLHRNDRPLHSATSFAMGVFWACTPFYGLQTLLIISSAFLFRLSFPMAFLGSQISLPPFYAVIVPLEVVIGFFVTGRSMSFSGPWLEMAQSHFTAWLIGALVLGATLATTLGAGWYWLQTRWFKDQA